MEKKVAIYLRVSTDEQNPDSQMKDLERYCKMRNWNIVKKFVDTGSRDNTKRKEYQDLLTFAYQGKCDVVLVWEISRFGSSMREAVNHYTEFKERDIDFASYKEQIDTTGPYGELVFALLTGLAHIELNNIRTRVKRGIEYAQENGTKSGNPIGRPPLPKEDLRTAIRLIDDNFDRHPEERMTVKQIRTQANISKTSYYRVLHVMTSLEDDPDKDPEKIKAEYDISDRMFDQILKAYNTYKNEVAA